MAQEFCFGNVESCFGKFLPCVYSGSYVKSEPEESLKG